VDGRGLTDVGATALQSSDAYFRAAQQRAAMRPLYTSQEQRNLDNDSADWEVKKFEHEQVEHRQRSQ
jgi:hypothetical protein